MEPLHALVDRISTKFLPSAGSNCNYFINEIPRELSIGSNGNWVASVIDGMIASAIVNTKNTCIRFAAKKYGHLLVLELREANRPKAQPDIVHLQEIKCMAEQIGGCLYIGMPEEERIMMSFSFPYFPLAA